MPAKKTMEQKSDERDRDIIKAVKDLRGKCVTFFDMVSLCGNQCAWTDRQIEEILDQAKILKTIYNRKVE